MSEKSQTPQTAAILVWDLPTRLFHWILVALVVAQWWTARNFSTMEYHLWGGYALLVLVLFRVIWGFAGSDTARFSDFVRGPGAVLAYVKTLLRGATPRHLGHNPLGGWSILAMLALLLVQAGTGLFASDDIFYEGPLYSWVSRETSAWLTTIHKLNFDLLLILIAIHLAAVLFYLLVKRENLIHPMLSGRKRLPADWAVPAPRMVGPWRGLAALAVASAGVGWLVW
jgi:cytochrome b